MGSTTGSHAITDTSKSRPKMTVQYPARQAAWRNVENSNDTGKIGRRQPNKAERIIGTCGALYSSAETTDEVSDGDNSSATNEDSYEPEDRLPTYVALLFEAAEPVDLATSRTRSPNSGNIWPSKLHRRRAGW